MKTALRPSSSALRCKPMIKPQLLGRIRTCSIQAMAHRNSVEHQQRLHSMAHEFLSHWIEGCRDGATDQIMNKIAKVVDPNIVMQAAHPLGNDKVKGLEELRAMLDVGHHSNITRVDMVAVSEDNNVAFCLVECEDYALEEFAISNSQDYSKTVRKAYAIVKLDMAYDEDDPSWMTLKITGISERGQLEPADSCMLAVLEPDHRLPSYGGREREGHEALKVAGSWHFPSQHISDHVGSPLPFMKHGVDKDAAEHSIAKWCAARCSDFDEDQLMKEAVDWDNFHLWDGYGVLPTACSYNADIKDQIAKDRPSANHSCLLPTPQVLELIKASKSKNKMRCTLVDRAVCSHNNVGFSHWRTHIRPKANPDARYVLEAMAVHVFNEKGKLLDIWMLRDPTPVEKQLMSAACALPEPGNKPPVYGSFRRVPRAPDGPPSIIPAARIQRV